MPTSKKTLVLGASSNPARYSNMAIKKLRQYGHPVVAIGAKNDQVDDVEIVKEKANFTEINTITLYLSAKHQTEYYDYILTLKPARIIFNPGAENTELARLAADQGIEVEEACTLVMLGTGQY